MAEKCPCQTYVTSCCACVSMHCDECHGHSKFVQGRFCSNCGRPLKAELTRLYVPKSEVERLEKEIKALLAFKDYFSDLYGHGLEVANWHENGALEPFDNFYESAEDEYETELKKEYMGGCDGK